MAARRTKIALIAHDGRKADMVAFATFNRDRLAEFDLAATATTGDLLTEKVGLPCQKMLSGPQGGDAQIAAMVAEGVVKAVIFLVDPLTSHPHDPDIQTVLRVCNVHNVPIATNVAAADLFVACDLLAPPELAMATPAGPNEHALS
jgi:methylglyoxal synthase